MFLEHVGVYDDETPHTETSQFLHDVAAETPAADYRDNTPEKPRLLVDRYGPSVPLATGGQEPDPECRLFNLRDRNAVRMRSLMLSLPGQEIAVCRSARYLSNSPTLTSTDGRKEGEGIAVLQRVIRFGVTSVDENEGDFPVGEGEVSHDVCNFRVRGVLPERTIETIIPEGSKQLHDDRHASARRCIKSDAWGRAEMPETFLLRYPIDRTATVEGRW